MKHSSVSVSWPSRLPPDPVAIGIFENTIVFFAARNIRGKINGRSLPPRAHRLGDTDGDELRDESSGNRGNRPHAAPARELQRGVAVGRQIVDDDIVRIETGEREQFIDNRRVLLQRPPPSAEMSRRPRSTTVRSGIRLVAI